jgi:tripartite-type tricarboxylate transporter receptor subunit TctC
MPDVPTGIELASTQQAKDMLRLYGVKFTAAYPVVLPPNVPAEQVRILREAFAATMKDPEFLAQMAPMRISGGMVTPDMVERFVKELDGAPKELVEQLRQVLEGK